MSRKGYKKNKTNKELDRLKDKHQVNKEKEEIKKLNNISNNAKKIINTNNNSKTKEHETSNISKLEIDDKNVKSNNSKENIKKQDGYKKSNFKKKKRNVSIVILLILLISLLCALGYYLNEEKKEKIRLENIRKEKELVEKINSHYNEFVKTKEEVNIYNDKEEVVGKLYNSELSLEEIEINKDTKYFKIKDFDNSYIKYEDVFVIDNLSVVNQRYKNYIVFNQNIVTNDKTIFYDETDNIVYEFNYSFDLPIIIKETGKYGIEFNNRLLYVKEDNVKEIKDNYNTDIGNASGVAVLNYHSFYDETSYEERLGCPTSICHSKAQFRQHLEYLKENNIFTLTAKEIEMYVDGKLQLPKSVYITIDDGVKTEHAVDLLTEYKMNATIFLVTSWAYEPNYYITEYIELHSHTHNLHNPGVCPGGQGGAIKCLDRETLLADLRQSREDLNGSTVFCYPFYEYNNYSISVLKEAGFTMAFGGQYGDMLVKVGMDKFRLPRFVITTSTTIYGLDNYFDRIKN